MSEITIGYHTSAWGSDGFVNALLEISEAGFFGVEMHARDVKGYEDRETIFTEMLENNGVGLIAVHACASLTNPLQLDEEVEKVINLGRFGALHGANVLVLQLAEIGERTLIDEEWSCLLEGLNNIGDRCADRGIKLCVLPARGTAFDSAKNIKLVLSHTKADTCHICLDTAHLAEQGINLKRFIKTNISRIQHAHFTDVTITKKGKKQTVERCEFGNGDVDFDYIIDALHDADVEGFAVIKQDGIEGSARFHAKDAKEFAEQTMDVII